jgi:hypothetical protein
METHWSDSDFRFPDDPFASVTIGGDAPAFAPFPASTQPEPLPPAPNAGWGWHDAAIITLERNDDPADGLPTSPLIRERADWHPHDPHAARTAQARSEGRTGWAVER